MKTLLDELNRALELLPAETTTDFRANYMENGALVDHEEATNYVINELDQLAYQIWISKKRLRIAEFYQNQNMRYYAPLGAHDLSLVD